MINSSIPVYKLFIDGGSRGNPGESGIGIVIQSKSQKKGFYFYTGISTNNEAEYKALIKGLKISISNGLKNLNVFSDSELLCKQINGLYKVKSDSLKNYYSEATGLIKRLNNFSIDYIPRKENKEADKLANIAMNLKKNGEMELAVAPSTKL